MSGSASYFSRLTAAVFGDPSLEGLQPRVVTYEAAHAAAQSILVPSLTPPGLQLNAIQPLSKHWALSHRLFLETNRRDPNPFAALMGGGKADAGESHRIYGLGAIGTRKLAFGMLLRGFAQVDTSLIAKAVVQADVYGNGRLNVLLQALAVPSNKSLDAALTIAYRGSDFASTLRVTNGPEAGVSYHQRLVPGSPLVVGGEVWYNHAAYKTVRHTPGASYPTPTEWALGASYHLDGGATAAVHFAHTGASPVILNMQFIQNCTDRCTLAAKSIVDPFTMRSMAAAGYKLSFRNTRTTLTGMADTYGGVRLLLERDVLKDVRVAAGLHINAWHKSTPQGEDTNTWGIKVNIGNTARLERPVSPCTMNRLIFATQ